VCVRYLGLRLRAWVGQYVTRKHHGIQQIWLSQQALLRILSGWPCVYNVCVCVCVTLRYGYENEFVNLYPGDNTVHNNIGSANKRYCAFYRVGPVCMMCACVCALSWATAKSMSWSICIQETIQYTTTLAQPTSAIAHFIGLALCVCVRYLGLRLRAWVGQYISRKHHSTQQIRLSQQALLRAPTHSLRVPCAPK